MTNTQVFFVRNARRLRSASEFTPKGDGGMFNSRRRLVLPSLRAIALVSAMSAGLLSFSSGEVGSRSLSGVHEPKPSTDTQRGFFSTNGTFQVAQLREWNPWLDYELSVALIGTWEVESYVEIGGRVLVFRGRTRYSPDGTFREKGELIEPYGGRMALAANGIWGVEEGYLRERTTWCSLPELVGRTISVKIRSIAQNSYTVMLPGGRTVTAYRVR